MAELMIYSGIFWGLIALLFMVTVSRKLGEIVHNTRLTVGAIRELRDLVKVDDEDG